MTVENVAVLLDGGRTAFCLVIAVVFVRLGRATHDRLYYAFASAFVLLALSSTLVGLRVSVGDYNIAVVLLRLIAHVMIIAAIIDKNRRAALTRARTRSVTGASLVDR